METIKINFGRIFYGEKVEKVWSVCHKNKKGLLFARNVRKSHIDKVLPKTETNEDYFLLVAKYMSKVFFRMLEEEGMWYNKKDYAFDCEGQVYEC